MALTPDVKKQTTPEELEELLEGMEKLLDRTKVLYEQYFMGIQKVAPLQLHRDIERKVRELTQQQIRNTGLRFRFSTLCQRFGSYNTYWKRTLREIEQGKYVRDLARVKRKADEQGEDLPEELLVKLPRLIQDRIRRDRARLAERARRHESIGEDDAEAAALELVERAAELPPEPPARVHEISEEEERALFSEGDLDLDGLFTAMTTQAGQSPQSAETPAPEPQPTPASTPEPTPEPEGSASGAAIPLSRVRLAKMAVTGQPGFRVPAPAGMKAAASPPTAQPTAKREEAPRTKAVAPPAPPPIPTRAAGVAPPPGMSDQQCRDLYSRYVKARQMVGEKTDDVTYEKLVSTLNKQASAIMAEHGARGVDFQVVVRGDRVVLKAKPLRSGK